MGQRCSLVKGIMSWSSKDRPCCFHFGVYFYIFENFVLFN